MDDDPKKPIVDDKEGNNGLDEKIIRNAVDEDELNKRQNERNGFSDNQPQQLFLGSDDIDGLDQKIGAGDEENYFGENSNNQLSPGLSSGGKSTVETEFDNQLENFLDDENPMDENSQLLRGNANLTTGSDFDHNLVKGFSLSDDSGLEPGTPSSSSPVPSSQTNSLSINNDEIDQFTALDRSRELDQDKKPVINLETKVRHIPNLHMKALLDNPREIKVINSYFGSQFQSIDEMNRDKFDPFDVRTWDLQRVTLDSDAYTILENNSIINQGCILNDLSEEQIESLGVELEYKVVAKYLGDLEKDLKQFIAEQPILESSIKSILQTYEGPDGALAAGMRPQKINNIHFVAELEGLSELIKKTIADGINPNQLHKAGIIIADPNGTDGMLIFKNEDRWDIRRLEAKFEHGRKNPYKARITYSKTNVIPFQGSDDLQKMGRDIKFIQSLVRAIDLSPRKATEIYSEMMRGHVKNYSILPLIKGNDDQSFHKSFTEGYFEGIAKSPFAISFLRSGKTEIWKISPENTESIRDGNSETILPKTILNKLRVAFPNIKTVGEFKNTIDNGMIFSSPSTVFDPSSSEYADVLYDKDSLDFEIKKIRIGHRNEITITKHQINFETQIQDKMGKLSTRDLSIKFEIVHGDKTDFKAYVKLNQNKTSPIILQSGSMGSFKDLETKITSTCGKVVKGTKTRRKSWMISNIESKGKPVNLILNSDKPVTRLTAFARFEGMLLGLDKVKSNDYFHVSISTHHKSMIANNLAIERHNSRFTSQGFRTIIFNGKTGIKTVIPHQNPYDFNEFEYNSLENKLDWNEVKRWADLLFEIKEKHIEALQNIFATHVGNVREGHFIRYVYRALSPYSFKDNEGKLHEVKPEKSIESAINFLKANIAIGSGTMIPGKRFAHGVDEAISKFDKIRIDDVEYGMIEFVEKFFALDVLAKSGFSL